MRTDKKMNGSTTKVYRITNVLPINGLVKIDAVATTAYQMITFVVMVKIFATTQWV